MGRRLLAFVPWLAALAIVAACTALIVLTSRVFQECVAAASEPDHEQAVPEYMRFVSPTALDRYFCIGTFVDENGDAIIAVFTVILAASTIALWWATRRLWQASQRQSDDMQASIAQAARAATAMENLAVAADRTSRAAADNVDLGRERSAIQMRAYLAVVIGDATYQEREKNLWFEARPNVINTGHTPARNVNYIAKAEILPVPLPADFAFPLPEAERRGQGVLNPHQSGVMAAGVSEYVDDAEVEIIKTGQRKALFVWGIVTYTDVFGDPHYTRFSHHMTWLPNGSVWGYYTHRHNDAD